MINTQENHGVRDDTMFTVKVCVFTSKMRAEKELRARLKLWELLFGSAKHANFSVENKSSSVHGCSCILVILGQLVLWPSSSHKLAPPPNRLSYLTLHSSVCVHTPLTWISSCLLVTQSREATSYSASRPTLRQCSRMPRPRQRLGSNREWLALHSYIFTAFYNYFSLPLKTPKDTQAPCSSASCTALFMRFSQFYWHRNTAVIPEREREHSHRGTGLWWWNSHAQISQKACNHRPQNLS